MPYEVNLLYKEGLQKKTVIPDPPTIDDELSTTSTNAVQNRVITTEINKMKQDTTKKVSKFFTSIEELEIGEIGEYQGETNETFTNGYFYKRQDVASLDFEPSGISLNFTEQLRIRYAPDKYIYQYHSGDIYQDYNSNYGMEVRQTAGEFVSVLLLNKNFVAATNMQTYVYNNIEFYVYPFGTIQQLDEPITGFAPDFDNPLQVVNNVIYYKNAALNINNARFAIRTFWGISKENPYIKYWWVQNYGCYIPFIVDYNVISVIYSPTISDLPIAHDAEVISVEPITIDFHDYTFYENAPFVRVDTQPALDPSNFATAAQGELADTAVQDIEHGTDGSYITTSVTAKDANKKQKVSASLKIQPMLTADDSHKGVGESSDIKKWLTAYIPYNPIYGVMWDTENPSPDCIRIGNLDLHATLPVHSQMIGGTLDDNAVFTPFDNQSDWTGETRDGSAGQVMMRFPEKFWYKFITEGTINKVLVSAQEVSGFQVFAPGHYMSAYKATLQRSTLKLSSVVNLDPDYRGGNNTADWDNTYRSLLGKPVSNVNLTNFRAYARARWGNNQGNCAVYYLRKMLYWLFVTEYATLNTQKEYNAALDANGYRQGGLGAGVTDWNGNDWNSYNGYNPLIPCGYTDQYGNQTAQMSYDVIASDGVSIAHSFFVPRYRGIESPFGDIWEWTDGILINKQADDSGGKSPVYVTNDPSKFSSSDFSQYDYLCDEIRTENFIKGIHFGDNGDIVCVSVPGSSTQYYCDWWYGANLPASGTSLRGVRFGGNAHSGTHAGFVYGLSFSVPAYADPYVGSRLCFLPSS